MVQNQYNEIHVVHHLTVLYKKKCLQVGDSFTALLPRILSLRGGYFSSGRKKKKGMSLFLSFWNDVGS